MATHVATPRLPEELLAEIHDMLTLALDATASHDSRPAFRKWKVPIAATSRFRASAVVFMASGAKPSSAMTAM